MLLHKLDTVKKSPGKEKQMKKTINFLRGWKDGILGLQHLIAMFGATTLVPLLTGLDVGVALFAAGIGTLLFHFVTKKKVPIFLGSSFAFIPGIIAVVAATGSTRQAQGGIVVAGLLYFAFAAIVHLIGLDNINKIFPRYVVGAVITIIGFSLIPTAVNMATTNILLALMTLFLAVFINIFGTGFLGQLTILISIAAGYSLSLMLNMVDLTLIQNAAWFRIPAFTTPEFSWTGISMIAPIVLATFMEHIGDVGAVQTITGKNFYKDPGLHRTLIGDGLATAFAGLIGGPANTTYGENTAVLKITKVFSPHILRIAAVFAIMLSFSGKISAIFQSTPTAVLGGISLMLFWMIAKVGIDTVDSVKMELRWYQWAVIVIMLLVGLGSNFTEGLFGFPIQIKITEVAALSGAGLAAIAGVLLNILVRLKDKKELGEIND